MDSQDRKLLLGKKPNEIWFRDSQKAACLEDKFQDLVIWTQYAVSWDLDLDLDFKVI